MVGEFNALADLAVQFLLLLSNRKPEELDEPDYTAALSSIFPVLLNREPTLSHIRFGGCFIHQKPKVSFDSTIVGKGACCEAGDLMVLCRQVIDGQERYNAVLFQIKMHDARFAVPHKITSKREKVQKELYTSWPKFTLKGHNLTTIYDILPKTITPAAQYMFVRRSGMHTKFNISYPQTSVKLDKFENIGRCIYEMVKWQTGRPISGPDDQNKDEWSKFVWNLVDISRQSFFNRRKKVGIVNEPRTSGDFFQLITLNSDEQFWPVELQAQRTGVGITYYLSDDDQERLIYSLKDNQYASIYESKDDHNEANGISLLFVDVINAEKLVDE